MGLEPNRTGLLPGRMGLEPARGCGGDKIYECQELAANWPDGAACSAPVSFSGGVGCEGLFSACSPEGNTIPLFTQRPCSDVTGSNIFGIDDVGLGQGPGRRDWKIEQYDQDEQLCYYPEKTGFPSYPAVYSGAPLARLILTCSVSPAFGYFQVSYHVGYGRISNGNNNYSCRVGVLAKYAATIPYPFELGVSYSLASVGLTTPSSRLCTPVNYSAPATVTFS